MGYRRRRGVFQTQDHQFNYRFGSPAMRKRYRVRSKRRLIIAICVLLVLLLIAGLVASLLLRDNDKPPADQTAGQDQETSTDVQPVPDDASSDTQADTDSTAQDTEEPAAAAELSPVAVAARALTADYAADAPSDGNDSKTPADDAASDDAASDDTDETPAAPLVKSARSLADAAAEAANAPAVDTSDWHLILVNPWNPAPEDFKIETVTLLNGMEFDARAVDDLDAMIDDCFNAGYAPLIASAYRSHSYQQQLFDEQVDYWMSIGYSEEDAYNKTAEITAVPGTSEHECGLAVDIIDSDYQELDEAQAETGTQQWLIEHCWEYGFILRYPPEKKDITGIVYEPWHYRYVGKEYAKMIHEQGVCLEEFVNKTEH